MKQLVVEKGFLQDSSKIDEDELEIARLITFLFFFFCADFPDRCLKTWETSFWLHETFTCNM